MNRLLLSTIRIAQLSPIPKTAPKPQISPSFSLFSFSAFSRLNYLSQTSFSPNSSDAETSNNPESSSLEDLPTDVTTQELKHRIDRYLKGDMEVLPSIFEGILARKLSGKHDDTDDELMEEFRSKTLQDEDQRFQSDKYLMESDEDLTDSEEGSTESDSD